MISLNTRLRVIVCCFVLLMQQVILFAKNDSKTLSQSTASALFIQNNGQLLDEFGKARKDLDFSLRANMVNVYVGSGLLQYMWAKQTDADNTKNNANTDKPAKPKDVTYYILNMRLVGANTAAVVEMEDIEHYTENYYNASINPKGISAKSCKKIVYKDIYPDIDWVLYTSGNDYLGMKYDFVVHPGGNPADIKLQYDGADNIRFQNGSLTINTPYGSITEQKPYTYNKETKQEIASSYKLNNNVVSFDVANTDGTIIIDPILNWGSYYGNIEFSLGTSVAADSIGNVFLCGHTQYSTSIASTAGVHQPLYGGGNFDGFIVRFLPDGTRDWATFFGGMGTEQINAATCDRLGNLIITGHSTSYWEISAVGMHQQYNGSFLLPGGYDYDAFLAKFTNTGTLAWSTFYGGSYYDEGFAVACDASNNIYFGGNSNSSNNISTSGAWRTTPSTGFLAKFSPNGSRLWATYYRGTVNTITCDGDKNVYFGGFTTATADIASSTAHLGSFAGGACDGYIAKFDSTGNTRIWGTYYGGLDYDEILSMVTDSFRNLYISGSTLSQSGIGTTGAFRPSYSGPNPAVATDAFLAKLNKDGVRQWGTYVGDSLGNDRITELSIAPNSALYCFGRTGSYTNIATPGNYDVVNSGPLPNPAPSPYFIPECDPFMMRFTPEGQRKWGTYYGDTGSEFYCEGAYSFGKIYIGGATNGGGVATSGGFQPQHAGLPGPRGFVAQFQADTNVFIKYPFADTMLCAGDTLYVKYNTTNRFRSTNTFTVQLSNIAGSFATPVNIASITAAQEGTIACYLPLTTVDGRGYKIRIISSAPADTFYNYDIPIRISQYRKPQAYAIEPVCENTNITIGDGNLPLVGNFSWTGPAGFTSNLANTFVPTATLAKAGDYILLCDNYGCKAKDTVNVRVVQSPAKSTITGDTSVCTGDTLLLTVSCPTPDIYFQWVDPKLTVPQNDTFFAAPVDTSYRGRYRVTAITNMANCPGEEDTVNVRIRPLPRPVIAPVPELCSGDSLKLDVTDTATVTAYSWVGPTGFTSTVKSPVMSKITLVQNGVYTVTNTNVFGCKEDTSITVVVKQSPDSVFASNNGPKCSKTELQLSATNNISGTTYSWAGPAGFSSTLQNPLLTNTTAQASGMYKVTVSLNGCTKESTTNVTVNQSPDTPVLTANTPLFIGETLKLQITNPQTGVAYLWTGPNNYQSDFLSPILTSTVLNMAGIYTVTASIADCKATSSIKIDVKEKPEQVGKTVYTYPNPNKGKFTLIAGTDDDMDVPIYIFGSDGKLVDTESAKPTNKKLEHVIDLGNKLSSGVYRVKVQISGKFYTTSVSIQ